MVKLNHKKRLALPPAQWIGKDCIWVRFNKSDWYMYKLPNLLNMLNITEDVLHELMGDDKVILYHYHNSPLYLSVTRRKPN